MYCIDTGAIAVMFNWGSSCASTTLVNQICFQQFLRIPAIHGAKTTKNHPIDTRIGLVCMPHMNHEMYMHLCFLAPQVYLCSTSLQSPQFTVIGESKLNRGLTNIWIFPVWDTRQLPMGAGHCPWGGHTDWNVSNIHGEVHAKNQVRRSIGWSTRGGYTWTDGKNHRPLLWIFLFTCSIPTINETWWGLITLVNDRNSQTQ